MHGGAPSTRWVRVCHPSHTPSSPAPSTASQPEHEHTLLPLLNRAFVTCRAQKVAAAQKIDQSPGPGPLFQR
eukprot:3286526-Prymnesium_polylepis.1